MPAAFYLYHTFRDLAQVKKHVVFTTHTPEKAGNEEHEFSLLEKMTFFGPLSGTEVRELTGMQNAAMLNYTQAALRLAKGANAVSKIHGEVARKMWEADLRICTIESITNAQNTAFWRDAALYEALENGNDAVLVQRKAEMKKMLIEKVADQTGKLFKTEVLTIVWARRFAGYKRPDLLLQDIYRFEELINRVNQPVQIIWAGKPYPTDHLALDFFNRLVKMTYRKLNVAVLTGYEIELSRILKQGADIWLNTPRRLHEASGTSGMTAAMNGSINFSVQDGWVPEFGRHGLNSFLFPVLDSTISDVEQDKLDYLNMMQILEEEIIPTYYEYPKTWVRIMKQSMLDVIVPFGANRMAEEYYKIMYQHPVNK